MLIYKSAQNGNAFHLEWTIFDKIKKKTKQKNNSHNAVSDTELELCVSWWNEHV